MSRKMDLTESERKGIAKAIKHLRDEWSHLMGFDDEENEAGSAPSWMREAADYLERRFLQPDERTFIEGSQERAHEAAEDWAAAEAGRSKQNKEIGMEDVGVCYQVLDGGRAADENGFPNLAGKGWTDSVFHFLDEARVYMASWLNVPEEDTKNVEPDTPFDYSGYGDSIEIKTIPIRGPKV